MTAVFPNSCKSVTMLRLWMYCRSILIHWSKGMNRSPFTCQIHVIPGVTSSRLRCQSLQLYDSSMGSGRGPTSDISPESTFSNCGNSSSDVRRINLPTLVTRAEFNSPPEPIWDVNKYFRLFAFLLPVVLLSTEWALRKWFKLL